MVQASAKTLDGNAPQSRGLRPCDGANGRLAWYLLATLLVLTLALSSLGCATGRSPTPSVDLTAPTEAVEEPAVETPPVAPQELAEHRQALATERVRSIEFEQQMVQLRSALAVAQLRYEALEAELADSVEEVLRAKASMRGVHSRALATSRIAEVRVALEESAATSSPSGAVELGRAAQFLERADAELLAENYGGAVYLAEKASDLVRRKRTDAELPGVDLPEASPIVPLMPALAMTITDTANLREGPGLGFERRGLIPAGEGVTVLASSGQWRHIERTLGDRGWVHSRLLELSATSAADAADQALALDPPQVLETTARVNLRLGPGLAFGSVLVLDRGEVLRAVASVGEWLRVERADGRSGWIYAPLTQKAAE